MDARMRGDVPTKIRSQLPDPADVPFWCLLWPVAHDSFLNHMLGIPWQNMVSEHALSHYACQGPGAMCWHEGRA